MQLTQIDIKNYAGVQSFMHSVTTPVTLIAGANGAGKSSIAEAIHHAFTGEPSRVELKKDFAERLLHTGADAGHVLISTDAGEHGVILPDGKVTGTPNQMLAYVTDPQRFARLTPNDRRKFVLQLMGVKMDAGAIATELDKLHHPHNYIDAIKPYLAGGFEAAEKQAKEFAKESKTAWRVTTGETYGDKKAEAWKASKFEFDAEKMQALKHECAVLDTEIEGLVEEYGASAGVNKQHAELTAQLEALREKGGRYARINDKLIKDRKELADWQAKVTEAEAKASGQVRTGLVHDLAGALHGLVNEEQPLGIERATYVTASQTLERYVEQHGEVGNDKAPDPEAVANLPKYRDALRLMESSVANGERDLAMADAAAQQIAGIEAKLAELKPVDVAELKQTIDDKKAMLKVKRDTREGLQTIERANAEADSKTEKALQYHKEVMAWDAIAQDLAPEGIQLAMLNAALIDFNKAIERAANWDCVKVGITSDIFVGEYLYSQRSEGEQWRADAMLAVAIAKLSGLKFVMLDRFDVLDMKGRSEAIKWLATTGVQAIVLGTLKELPATLPSFMDAVWLEAGTVKEEVAA